MIVSEFSHSFVFWADARVSGRSDSMRLQIVPVAVPVRASGVVVDEVVVGVCDPEAGWGLIGVEETPGSLGHDDEVSRDVVVPLDSVLDEDRVAHAVESDVVGDPQVLVAVDGEGSVERGVHRVALGIRFVHRADEMEMDWVSAHLEGLPHLGELSVGESRSEGVITLRVDEDDRSVLVVDSVLIVSLVDDASGQETNFSSHVDLLAAIGLSGSEMLVDKRLVESDDWCGAAGVDNGSDCSLLSLSAVVGSRGDGNHVSSHPVDGRIQFDGCASGLGSFKEHSPGGLPGGTVHVQGGLAKTDAFVSVEGQVGIRDRSVHGDGDQRIVREVGGSHLHLAAADEDVVGVELSMVGLISRMRREDQGALDDEGVDFRRHVDVHQEIEPSRNVDRLAIHGSVLASPGVVGRPVVGVGEQQSLLRNGTFAGDRHVESGVVETGSRASGADDLRIGHRADCAHDFVDDDGDIGHSGSEAGSSEGDVFSAHDVSVSGYNAFQKRSQCAVVSHSIEVCGGSICMQFRNAIISCIRIIDCFNTIELNLVKLARIGCSSFKSIVLVLWRASGVKIMSVPSRTNVIVSCE